MPKKRNAQIEAGAYAIVGKGVRTLSNPEEDMGPTLRPHQMDLSEERRRALQIPSSGMTTREAKKFMKRRPK